MAIDSIRIINIMAFGLHSQNSDRLPFALKFADGINVIIGENGTGKTTLLKLIYAAIQWKNEHSAINHIDNKTIIEQNNKFAEYFSKNLSNDDLINNLIANSGSIYEITNGSQMFSCSVSNNKIISLSGPNFHSQGVFIPTTEMLSHSKGFLALDQKFHMPFDQTQVDIIVNASLPEAREIPVYMQAILDKISTTIDGEVIQEDDEFYVLKKNGRKLRFSLEAEGLRKLGLLWKLIRNGLLEPGTVLLWDEPEANLNPELFPLVTEILLELQKNGIQIFVATHSYNFAKYLEIRRTETEQVQFHNLYHSEQPGVIEASSAYRMEDLHNNRIMIADNKLLDEIYDL